MGNTTFQKRDDKYYQVVTTEKELGIDDIDKTIKEIEQMIDNANRRISTISDERVGLEKLIKQWQENIDDFELYKASVEKIETVVEENGE